MTRIYPPQNDRVPSDEILHLFNLDRSGRTLMPGLQLLSWTTSRASLPWLHHLLSPNLPVVEIDFNGGHAAPVTVAVIKALPTTNLKRVAFSALRTNSEVNAALWDLVLNSKRLGSIYIQQAKDIGSSGEVKDQGEPIELESLESVKIVFNTEPAFLPTLFKRSKLPNVHEIHAVHCGKTDWPGADDLFGSMLGSASPGVFHAFRYISNFYGIDITPARIEPLRRFVALRNLRVTSQCTITRCKFFLSDDDVSAIAIAMPNLVELHLGGIPCSSPANVSVRGLAALAANCTKLVGLQIHFDTTRFVDKALDVSGERTIPPQLTQGSCQLTQLSVGRMALAETVDGRLAVAMALSQMFPNLESIKCKKLHESWEEVMKIIKVQRYVANLVVVRPANPLLSVYLTHTKSDTTG